MSECTPEEHALAQTSGGHFTCLSRGQAIGSAVRVEAGLVSLLALVVTFVLIARNVIRCWRRPPVHKWSLFAAPADIYVFFVLLFDTVQCIGRTHDIRWVKEGKVYAGSYCTTAGAIQQVGETGSAQVTLAMAVHAFVTIWARKGAKARWVAASIIVLICLYNILFVSIGIALNKGDHPYDSPSKYWCWIGPDIPNARAVRIAGQYAWIWIALISTYLFYVPLFFFARGNITIDDRRPWRFWFHRRHSDSVYVRSIGILALPVVYAVTALPTSVGRWYGFAHETGPNQMTAAATFAVSSIYGLTGLFNVLLLFARPEVLLFGSSAPGSSRPTHTVLPSATTPDGGSSKVEITEAPLTPSTYSPTAVPQHGRPTTGSTYRPSVGPLPADESDEEEIVTETRQRGGSDATRLGYGLGGV